MDGSLHHKTDQSVWFLMAKEKIVQTSFELFFCYKKIRPFDISSDANHTLLYHSLANTTHMVDGKK